MDFQLNTDASGETNEFALHIPTTHKTSISFYYHGSFT